MNKTMRNHPEPADSRRAEVVIPSRSFTILVSIVTLSLLHGTACALPAAPATLTREPSALSGSITLSWSTFSGATGYTVKRGTSFTICNKGTVQSVRATLTEGVPGRRFLHLKIFKP